MEIYCQLGLPVKCCYMYCQQNVLTLHRVAHSICSIQNTIKLISLTQGPGQGALVVLGFEHMRINGGNLVQSCCSGSVVKVLIMIQISDLAK